MAQQRGRVIVISGPSGSGKTTLVKRVLKQSPLPLALSVSATTRSPREGEVDGVDYHFLSSEEFARRRDRGDFLESFEVYSAGTWYGTLKEEVEADLQAGKCVVLEIDVQGTFAVLEHYPDAVTIFVRPGSEEELERRLRGRGTETDEAIRRRLEGAHRELTFADRYCYQVINDNVEDAVQEICDILTRTGESDSCWKN
jgi:guanylate kinase